MVKVVFLKAKSLVSKETMSDSSDTSETVSSDRTDSTDDSEESDSNRTGSSSEGEEEQEEENFEPLFHLFVHEAINSLNTEELGKIENKPDKVTKIVRKKLAEILVEKMCVKEHWKFDPDLQRLSKTVKRYMKNEKDDEYYPAIRYALQQRKFSLDKLIKKKLRENAEEETEEEDDDGGLL